MSRTAAVVGILLALLGVGCGGARAAGPPLRSAVLRPAATGLGFVTVAAPELLLAAPEPPIDAPRCRYGPTSPSSVVEGFPSAQPLGQAYSTLSCPPVPADRPVVMPSHEAPYLADCASRYTHRQRDLWRTYETASEPAVRDTAALLLSELWAQHLLEPALKDAIVARELHPLLVQVHLPGRLVLEVQLQSTFPFPSNWIAVRPARRRNGRLEWAAASPLLHDSMGINGAIVTVLETADFCAGDEISFDLELTEWQGQVPIWRGVVSTNTVRVRETRTGPAFPETTAEPSGAPGSAQMCPVLPEGYAVRLPAQGASTFVDCPLRYRATQRELLARFEQSQDSGVRATAAYLLSGMWREHLLDPDLRTALLARHHRFVLVQLLYPDRLELTVRAHSTFPFPPIWIEYTATRTRDGRVEWSENRPGLVQQLWHQSTTITSLGGGPHRRGERFRYEIGLTARSGVEVLWRAVQATNEVTTR